MPENKMMYGGERFVPGTRRPLSESVARAQADRARLHGRKARVVKVQGGYKAFIGPVRKTPVNRPTIQRIQRRLSKQVRPPKLR